MSTKIIAIIALVFGCVGLFSNICHRKRVKEAEKREYKATIATLEFHLCSNWDITDAQYLRFQRLFFSLIKIKFECENA